MITWDELSEDERNFLRVFPDEWTSIVQLPLPANYNLDLSNVFKLVTDGVIEFSPGGATGYRRTDAGRALVEANSDSPHKRTASMMLPSELAAQRAESELPPFESTDLKFFPGDTIESLRAERDAALARARELEAALNCAPYVDFAHLASILEGISVEEWPEKQAFALGYTVGMLMRFHRLLKADDGA